ncbi:hypothetical protein J2X20_002759 [Pelomonas saccharophila]|uniref:HEPN AbiU2-like domain-containing protein n=1 Tax=Roseateles saccharophilus TaxID=304 RepID=A0ABU1YQ79_ROSSA|nr:hypothetical protein [Roseateles saccharophilus]MDR7270101.1 hypothetical protein [Roseateles saccharophilus]
MPSREIQAAYAEFTAAAAMVAHEQGLVHRLIRREADFLREQQTQAAAMHFSGGPVHQSMVFREMRQRRPIFYASSEPSYDELIFSLTVSHNRQYQWLLAEAFELFETFVLDAMACAGAKDPSVWDQQDLRRMGAYAGQDAAWWVAQARALKHPPPTAVALNRLRQLPGVRQLEENNAHQVDFRLVLQMIERMRHVIVHNRGQVNSKDEFATGVLRDLGMLSGGRPRPEDAAFIGQFVGNGKLKNTILLLEYPLASEGPGTTYIDVWDHLLGWMLSYAHMLSERL